MRDAGATWQEIANQCVLIGDSGTDWNAAKKNGMAFIGVTYGFQEVAPADFLAKTVPQLEGLDHYAQIYLQIGREIGYLAKPTVVGISRKMTPTKPQAYPAGAV